MTILEEKSDKISIPGRLTFGGFFPLAVGTPTIDLPYVDFLRSIQKRFGGKKVEITFPPSYFLPEVFDVQRRLLSELTQSAKLEFGMVIDLGEKQETLFKRDKQRQNRKFLDNGGLVRRALPAEWHCAYQVLRENRIRRGANLSMPLDKFIRTVEHPSQVHECWVATFEEKIVGAALTVELSSESAYVLFWGDTVEGRGLSSTTAMAAHLVSNFQGRSFRWLDLGTITSFESFDSGLHQFKSELGGSPTSKYTIELEA